MRVALYAVRYQTPANEQGVVYVMAKSLADAMAQVKGCSPMLSITGANCADSDDTPTPEAVALATVLQRTAGILSRIAESDGPGRYQLQQQARAHAQDALLIAAEVLSRG